MIKLHKSDRDFLRAFSKSNEWAILKARLIDPLIKEVQNVNSEFNFDDGTTNGERYIGRKMASNFAIGMVKLIERFGEDKTTKPEDYFE